MRFKTGNKNMYVYIYKRYIILHRHKTAGQETPEIMPSFIKYTLLLQLPLHCRSITETSLDIQRHDIDKAECNIGTHAVDKHCVNMLRLNKVFFFS